MTNPIRPTDDDARALARTLIDTARFGAIGTLADGAPMVTRIAIGTALDGTPISLMSDLSHHTKALRLEPRASLLLGEPDTKGDPLTHPRLTLQCTTQIIEHNTPEYGEMRGHYLTTHPKSKLYIDFADFVFARFTVIEAHLNGGFGKAFRLTPADLAR